jgi:hypothetical protein
LGSLLECVQNIDGVGPRRDVDHPKCSRRVTHANLPDARADALHRLSVVWIETALNPFELEAGVASRGFGKSTKSMQRVTQKFDRLHR